MSNAPEVDFHPINPDDRLIHSKNMLDRTSFVLISLISCILLYSIPVSLFMASVVHRKTGGIGDGSLRDMIVLATIIGIPIYGAVVAFMYGRYRK